MKLWEMYSISNTANQRGIDLKHWNFLQIKYLHEIEPQSQLTVSPENRIVLNA
jgi:hypothetical protein